ncbi:sciellin isoform 2-T2 [Symphorus nematophorus]
MNKHSSSLLKDNSWIKKPDDEDEDIDRDTNFGKILLSGRTSETPVSSETEETTKPVRTSTTSVSALTKRFSGGLDEPRSSTLLSSKTPSDTKSSYSSLKSDPSKTTTTTTVSKDGTTETITTTTQSLKSPVIGSPTTTFTERVKSSSKGAQYSYSPTPTRTTKVTETTVTSDKDAEDKLFDTLIPSSIKDDVSPTDSKTTVYTTETVTVKSSPDNDAEDKLYDTLIPSSIKSYSSPTESKTYVSSTETVTVKSSPNGDSSKTTTTTRTSSTAEDDLYSTLIPKSITSDLPSSTSTSIRKREIVTLESSRGGESPTLSSPSSTRRTTSYSSYTDDIPYTSTTSYTISTKPSEDYTSETKTYTYSRPDNSYEYSSITSPTVYTSTSYKSSRSDDTDSVYTTSSKRSVYGSSDRTVLEKDLCTFCRKPFTGDAKMVLAEMKINCHASCFKCQVCNSTLGHLKAGDSLWVYRDTVHCENCFEITKDKWRR